MDSAADDRQSPALNPQDLSRAFDSRVRQLWSEQVLNRDLNGALTRDDAIAEAGIDWVELAERRRRAVLEDVAWALRD